MAAHMYCGGGFHDDTGRNRSGEIGDEVDRQVQRLGSQSVAAQLQIQTARG